MQVSKSSFYMQRDRKLRKEKQDMRNNWFLSIAMPELKFSSINLHIPGFGLRNGSSVRFLLFTGSPQAMKTCIRITF